MLTSANGGQTIFELHEGAYLPPQGDTTIKLEKKESAFYLENPPQRRRSSSRSHKARRSPGCRRSRRSRQDRHGDIRVSRQGSRSRKKKKKIVEPLEALAPKPSGAICPTNGDFEANKINADDGA